MCNASTDIPEKTKCYVNMHCFCCNNKVCRQLDDFAIRVSKQTRNTNSEISEHDGFKLFPFGFAGYIRNENRVDGGWHLSMTRHLHVWLCTSDFLPNDKKLLCSTACCKLYEVDTFLRWPVKKTKLAYYSVLIDDLLEILVELCRPYYKCQGNSFKFHWPRHWVYFRLHLRCPAAGPEVRPRHGSPRCHASDQRPARPEGRRGHRPQLHAGTRPFSHRFLAADC